MRKLVFENNQRCPVPLRRLLNLGCCFLGLVLFTFTNVFTTTLDFPIPQRIIVYKKGSLVLEGHQGHGLCALCVVPGVQFS